MKRTVYSVMTSEDLVDYALQRDNATDMEIELAQRLFVAVEMLEEDHGSDTRESGEEGRQAKTN